MKAIIARLERLEAIVGQIVEQITIVEGNAAEGYRLCYPWGDMAEGDRVDLDQFPVSPRHINVIIIERPS